MWNRAVSCLVEENVWLTKPQLFINGSKLVVSSVLKADVCELQESTLLWTVHVPHAENIMPEFSVPNSWCARPGLTQCPVKDGLKAVCHLLFVTFTAALMTHQYDYGLVAVTKLGYGHEYNMIVKN